MNKVENERRHRLKLLMRYPNTSFCDNSVHDESDEKIRSEIQYSIYDYDRSNPIPYNIFRCSTCGKEYSDGLVQA